MTTTPNHLIAATIPDPSGVDPPAGFEACYWEDRPEYRVISGTSRGVAGRPSITVTPTALQLGDGTIDDGSAIEAPKVFLNGIGGDGLSITEARELAGAVLAAADELAALVPETVRPLDTGPGALRAILAAADELAAVAPEHPLDKFSTVEILTEIERRVRAAGIR